MKNRFTLFALAVAIIIAVIAVRPVLSAECKAGLTLTNGTDMMLFVKGIESAAPVTDLGTIAINGSITVQNFSKYNYVEISSPGGISAASPILVMYHPNMPKCSFRIILTRGRQLNIE